MRAKLQLFVDNYHRFPKFLKKKLSENRYLLAIDVDPEEDPFEKETPDKRINERITDVGKRLDFLSEDLVRVSQSLDALHDRHKEQKEAKPDKVNK